MLCPSASCLCNVATGLLFLFLSSLVNEIEHMRSRKVPDAVPRELNDVILISSTTASGNCLSSRDVAAGLNEI